MKTTTIVRSVLLTAICLLASNLSSSAQNLFVLTPPDGSFSAFGPGITNANFSVYANQNPNPGSSYNPYGITQTFNDWVNTAANFQFYPVSGGVETNFPQVFTLTSLNTVGTIINNATYTLTFALRNPNANAGNVTLSLFTGTSTTDPFDYSVYTNPVTLAPYAAVNPNPIIGVTHVLASSFITGSSITPGYSDYTVSFNTLGGANSAYVGQSFYAGLEVDYGGQTDFGNARLTELAVVPEPSTWALMLAGVVGLFVVGRRKLVS